MCTYAHAQAHMHTCMLCTGAHRLGFGVLILLDCPAAMAYVDSICMYMSLHMSLHMYMYMYMCMCMCMCMCMHMLYVRIHMHHVHVHAWGRAAWKRPLRSGCPMVLPGWCSLSQSLVLASLQWRISLDVSSGEVPGQTFATRRIAPFNFLVTIDLAHSPN